MSGVWPDIEHQCSVRAQEAAEDGLQGDQEVARPQHRGLQHLLATEGQELRSHGRGAPRGPPHLLEVPPSAVTGWQVGEYDIGEAQHHAHHVVDLVGDPAREFAYSIHALARPQPLIHQSLRSDVQDGSGEVPRLARVVEHDLAVITQPPDAAVVTGDPKLDLEPIAPLHGLSERRARPFAVLWVNAVEELVQRDDRVALAEFEEFGEGRVQRIAPATEVPAPGPDARSRRRQPEAVVALREALQEEPLIGKVAEHLTETQQSPVIP